MAGAVWAVVRWLARTWTGRLVLLSLFWHLLQRRKRRRSLVGRNVVITGAARGIGREIAYEVILWDVNDEDLLVTAAEFRRRHVGQRVQAYHVDVANAQAVYAAAARARHEFGFIDIVINNAGIVSGRLLLETPDESIQHTFNVNSLAHFWATKAFLPAMLERNSGHLVFMASVAGMHGAARMVDYCSSKFAVVGFEESLRAELTKLGSTGVRTSCICPAHVKTDLFMGYDPGTMYSSLTPKYVAYKVIEAVQQGDVVVLLPNHLWLASVVKAFLPTDWVNTLKHAVRVNDSMDTFVPPASR